MMRPARRLALARLSQLGGAGLVAAVGSRPALASPPAATLATPASAPASDTPRRKRQVLMLAHPDMTALDLVGPQLIFASMPDTEVRLVWKQRTPIVADSGLQLLPDLVMAEAPPAPDILFVPGGLKGSTALMGDEEVLDFLRQRGERAGWVSSVCTGALVLGAAGLLQGHRATTHWYVHDLLPLFGARPVKERVVMDRNRLTGGGVTAGIDLALTLSAALCGAGHARLQELVFEYAPQPPMGTGTPERAGTELTQAVLARRRPAIEAARQAARQAGARLKPPA